MNGLVVEVTQRNINEVEALRVRDTEGQVWTFTAEGFIGFTPSHLVQHQLFGEAVLVTYTEKADTLVAVRVEDYFPSAP